MRLLEEQAKADAPGVDEETFKKSLGSFLQMEKQFAKQDAEFDALYPEEPLIPPTRASSRFEPAYLPSIGGVVDVPFSIGRSR